jgi:catechol 2,3-dioxygenase-like lactoylglutathione lyase family enzyme
MRRPTMRMVVARQRAACRWRARRSVLRRSWPRFDHQVLVASTIHRSPRVRGCFFTPGTLRFVVDAVDDVLDRLRAHGAELVGEVAQYEDIYRYYVRGPDGIIIGLVEELR